MFYQFMKWYLGLMVKLYFRRVYKAGMHHIPLGKPAIFASNHPAGFIEPIILGTNVNQPIHFLVLGSFLTSRYLQWFFRGVKMVPIYRRDITGNQTIQKNQSTFQFVNDALKRDAHILIYPEAKTQFIYKTRPLRKGIVRMAREFLVDQKGREMYIVPVGVNFLYPSKFRSDVFMQIGEAIRLNNTEGEEQEWYRKKLNEIFERMRLLMFDVHDENRHETVQHAVQIYHNRSINRPEIFYKAYKNDDEYVQKIRDLVSGIDALSVDEFDALKKAIDAYLTRLKSSGLNDIVVRSNFRIGILRLAILVIGLPFFLTGALLNGFSLLAGFFVKNTMVKRIEYKAAVAAAIPTVLTLIFFILFLILGMALHWAFFILAAAMPVSLYIFIYYFDLLSQSVQYLKWKTSKRKLRAELLGLKEMVMKYLL
jgi:1-acyl-sn-glycerol-3-phosphate acyltransferase